MELSNWVEEARKGSYMGSKRDSDLLDLIECEALPLSIMGQIRTGVRRGTQSEALKISL